ncbi:MAG: hypothetical protein NTV04_08665, partial [Deltaproteobacteria bacterium]|nr:hypothetical protein [Deltaproteobacteria bacterium]
LQIYWGWQRNATVFDGFVKSPSAALRFNFVVAAYLYVRFTPQFLRALHLELFTNPSLATLVWKRSLFPRSSPFAESAHFLDRLKR